MRRCADVLQALQDRTNRCRCSEAVVAGPFAGGPRHEHACAGECAMAFQLTGPAMTVSRGLDARAEAREVAADFLATRRAQRIVVVSVDAPGPCADLVLEKTGWPVDFQARAELWGI